MDGKHMQLETNRLKMRYHTLSDFDRFWDMINDPVAKRYTGGVTQLTYDKRLALFQEECEAPFSEQSTEFAITDRANGKYLGYCGFRFSLDLNGNEFLYGLCRDSWGFGYGAEAAFAVLDYLFLTLSHSEYVATVHTENVASVRLLQKLGFKQTGNVLIDGLHPVQLYAIARDVFKT